jgi:hypothetical protein
MTTSTSLRVYCLFMYLMTVFQVNGLLSDKWWTCKWLTTKLWLEAAGAYFKLLFHNLIRNEKERDKPQLQLVFSRSMFEIITFQIHSFPELKWPGRDADHPPPSSAQIKLTVELYSHYSSGFSWLLLGWIYLSNKRKVCWPIGHVRTSLSMIYDMIHDMIHDMIYDIYDIDMIHLLTAIE